MESKGWFADVAPGDTGEAVGRIRDGNATSPADWPAVALETGFVESREEYYDRLHEVTVAAAGEAASERERADDQQLIHAIRTVEDLADSRNELAERLAEWAGSYYGESGSGVEYARTIAAREPDGAVERRVVSLASRVVALEDEREAVRSFVRRQAPAVAPNLSMLAGAQLAARLIALAGSLESLAKKPSGTVQVLGAEDALFAHLRGQATSPKHGVIYTHEYVKGTQPEDRGSAARALAGKLSIAARVDYYSGDRRPSLQTELDERMARIRSRATDPEEGDR
ncbi:MAG: NOP5/NOP56 family protein [Halanaeroarchaeum sp.]